MLEVRAWVCVAVLGCGDPGQLGRSVVAPTDVTLRVALADVPVRGASVTVERNDDTSLKGELLAASEKEVFVLADGNVTRVGADAVKRVAIKRYDNHVPNAVIATWSALGALGALTQGYLAIGGEPVWAGVAAGAIVPVAADEGRFAYTERQSDFTFLHEYARFPQGLPPAYAARSSPK
jgi:hypothetical protein